MQQRVHKIIEQKGVMPHGKTLNLTCFLNENKQNCLLGTL